MGVAHRTFQPETINVKETRVDEQGSMRGGRKDSERTFNRKKNETIENFLLRLIEVNYWKTVANEWMNKSFDEIADNWKSGILTTTDDAADTVNGIPYFWKDGAEVKGPFTVLLEGDAKIAKGVKTGKLLLAKMEFRKSN